MGMEGKNRHIVDLSWKIHRILNKLNRLESTTIRVDDGITIAHNELHTIQAIGEMENVNVTKLGSHFGVSKSAASQQVSNLVKKGLVAKEQSAYSGKELHLTLTELGWKAYIFHEKYHSNNIEEIAGRLEGYSVAQITTTSNMLEVIENVADERLAEE